MWGYLSMPDFIPQSNANDRLPIDRGIDWVREHNYKTACNLILQLAEETEANAHKILLGYLKGAYQTGVWEQQVLTKRGKGPLSYYTVEKIWGRSPEDDEQRTKARLEWMAQQREAQTGKKSTKTWKAKTTVIDEDDL